MLQLCFRRLTSLSAWRLRSTLCGLVLVLITLGYVLLAIGVHTRDPDSADDANANNRHTRDLMAQEPSPPRHNSLAQTSSEDQSYKEEAERFVDVMKLRPKVLVFDPLAAIRNQSQGQRDALAKKMQEVEAVRQDVYLKTLRKRGQLVDNDGAVGGQSLISVPSAPLYLPNVLKFRPIGQWLPREKIWLNLTHFPWPDDERCKGFSVRFSEIGDAKPPPPVGLVSYPGSGNTWLRFLIEGATGRYTGSMYNDVHLKQKGLYGEGVPFDSGLTPTVKSHGSSTGPCVELVGDAAARAAKDCDHVRQLGRRAVLLVRDPFRAIVSHRNLDAGGHRTFAEPEQFQGQGWDDFVSVKIRSWENLYLTWLSEAAPEDLLVVTFEEGLQQEPKETLRKVAEFVGSHDQDLEERLDCALGHPEERFHRVKDEAGSKEEKSTVESPSDPYNPEQIKVISSAVERVSRALVRARKRPLPTHLYMH